MKTVKVNLFDRNGDVQYGLNWGNRDNRDRNEAYLQLPPDVYKSNFFPEKGTYFIVETDDNETLIMNRAQKGVGTAIQTPENNATLGLYIRKRLGIPSGTEITADHLNSSKLTEFIFTKIDNKHYRLSISTSPDTNSTMSQDLEKVIKNADDTTKRQFSYLRAMRTKPFLLLAGISGTGKSRIVKQMAFDSCPDNAVLRSDLTSPGNYCLIEVKPNWHDSTELLGYESQIGQPHYQLTPFVKFLAKAMLYPDVPFFVCLDEMNLAPVEQYFAEFLSVLESRTKLEDGHIVSEPIIKAEIFSKYPLDKSLFSLKEETSKYSNVTSTVEPTTPYGKEAEVYEQLKKQGLRIPENVIVIGTVNMDETTHQFSRKVIDRAMTIEMNLPEGKNPDGSDINPFMDFFANASELTYRANPTLPALYLPTETKASDVVKALAANNAEKTEWLIGEVAKVLTDINSALEGTPFKVAYRVQNELMLYFYQLWLENKSAKWRYILDTSVDQILMMKVLPRVEGDKELLEAPIDSLITFCDGKYPNASKKLKEMKDRLEMSQFTSFWP